MSKADKTRQLIIEKAAEVINRKGMAGTSISDIMQATQLAKGGIYGNFESKDEICLEVFNFLSSSMFKAIDDSLKNKSTPKEKLFALLNYYRDSVKRTDIGGCPMLNFGTEADDTNPLIKEKVAGAILYTQEKIKQLLVQGISEGSFKESVNAEEFAIKIFTMLEGAILSSRVLNKNQLALVVSMLKKEIEIISN